MFRYLQMENKFNIEFDLFRTDIYFSFPTCFSYDKSTTKLRGCFFLYLGESIFSLASCHISVETRQRNSECQRKNGTSTLFYLCGRNDDHFFLYI